MIFAFLNANVFQFPINLCGYTTVEQGADTLFNEGDFESLDFCSFDSRSFRHHIKVKIYTIFCYIREKINFHCSTSMRNVIEIL